MKMKFLTKGERMRVEKVRGYKREYINELRDEWWYADESDEVMPIKCRQVG